MRQGQGSQPSAAQLLARRGRLWLPETGSTRLGSKKYEPRHLIHKESLLISINSMVNMVPFRHPYKLTKTFPLVLAHSWPRHARRSPASRWKTTRCQRPMGPWACWIPMPSKLWLIHGNRHESQITRRNGPMCSNWAKEQFPFCQRQDLQGSRSGESLLEPSFAVLRRAGQNTKAAGHPKFSK